MNEFFQKSLRLCRGITMSQERAALYSRDLEEFAIRPPGFESIMRGITSAGVALPSLSSIEPSRVIVGWELARMIAL